MRSVTAFFTVSSIFFINLCHADFDWPMVNGCRERTSWAEDEWSLAPAFDDTTIHYVASEHVVYYDHRLYVAQSGSPNTVVAFNLETESELWSFEIPESGGSCGCIPAVVESYVYCGGQNGLGLYALDRTTGGVEWHREIGSLYTRNPIVDENRVYVIQDSLYCLEGISGVTLWTYPVSGQLTPAVDETNVYVASGSTTFALDKITGELVWEVAADQRLTIGLSVDDGATYSFEGNRLVGRQKADGSLLWEYQTAGNIAWLEAGALAVSDSFLCYINWEDTLSVGRLTTLDKHSGLYRWHHSFDGPGVFTPVIANDIVYLIHDDSHWLFGFDVHNGTLAFVDSSYWYDEDIIVANHSLYAGANSILVEFRNTVDGDLPIRKESLLLGQSYPNPSTNLAVIPFRLERSSIVRLVITDLGGRCQRAFTDELSPGSHEIRLCTEGLSPGTYIYRLETAKQARSRRLTVIR